MFLSSELRLILTLVLVAKSGEPVSSRIQVCLSFP
jgi:hypothetical protein